MQRTNLVLASQAEHKVRREASAVTAYLLVSLRVSTP